MGKISLFLLLLLLPPLLLPAQSHIAPLGKTQELMRQQRELNQEREALTQNLREANEQQRKDLLEKEKDLNEREQELKRQIEICSQLDLLTEDLIKSMKHYQKSSRIWMTICGVLGVLAAGLVIGVAIK
jgi:uncharacterized protein YaiL (DUF2058 family)